MEQSLRIVLPRRPSREGYVRRGAAPAVSASAMPQWQHLQFASARTWRKHDMHARRYLTMILILPLASCTETTGANLSDVPGYLISSVRVSPSIDTIFVPDSIRDSDRKIGRASCRERV